MSRKKKKSRKQDSWTPTIVLLTAIIELVIALIELIKKLTE